MDGGKGNGCGIRNIGGVGAGRVGDDGVSGITWAGATRGAAGGGCHGDGAGKGDGAASIRQVMTVLPTASMITPAACEMAAANESVISAAIRRAAECVLRRIAQRTTMLPEMTRTSNVSRGRRKNSASAE